MPTKKPSRVMQDIRRSLELQKPRREDAAKFLRAYAGDYSIKGRKSLDDIKDEVFLNTVYAYVETGVPKIFFGEPRVSVESKNRSSDSSAPNMQATINYWFRELGAKKHFKRCAYDRYFGHAAMVTEWEYDEIMEEVPVILYADPATGRPVLGPPRKELRVTKDQPIIRRPNPWNIILDPDSEAPEFDRVRWERFLVTKEQFQAMDGISAKVKEQIQPRQMPSDLTRLPFESEKHIGTNQEWIVLYKGHDVENDECYLLADSEAITDYLYIKPWQTDFEVGNDRFPITILEGKPSPESNYSFSEFRAYWTQIMERNRVRTTLQSHARRIHPNWLYQKGAMDESEAQRIADGKIGELIGVKNPGAIVPKPYPEIPLDLYKYDQITADDLGETSNNWENRSESIADTATEASLMASRGSLKTSADREAMEDFISTVGAKIGGLCQQYMDKAIAVKIKNPRNPQELAWMDLDKSQIQGEFNYVVKAGSMQHQNQDTRKQQTLKFAELMSANPNVNQRILAERLCEVFDIEADEILRSPEEMQQEQAGQLPEKPPLQIDKIKPELLAPEIQNMVVMAALQQNGVDAKDLPGMAAGAPPAGGLPPNMMQPPPPDVSVSAELNQAPPVNDSAMMPPPSPIAPISEGQGGMV